MKICVVTSYAAADEPRAPRHAVAARHAFPTAKIVFVDLAPATQGDRADPPILAGHDIERVTLRYPVRSQQAARLGLRKLRTGLARLAFRLTQGVSEAVFGERAQGLNGLLRQVSADMYIAHNIETLLPVFVAARDCAHVVFDCMEYYADMGDSQSHVERCAAQKLQQLWLPRCSLLFASSDALADALSVEYAIQRPLPTYNVPEKHVELPRRIGGGLNVYWRNAVIDFGQRGLDDALVALSVLPSDVMLFVQGRLPPDGNGRILARACSLGIEDRVRVLPPHAPQEAVRSAALYDIGLCLERSGPRNHDLTVSNKMFDYHMAGLAVVSSDVPSLSQVLRRSSAGLTYEAGNPMSLAEGIKRLHASPTLLSELQQNARKFALREANLESEFERLARALRGVVRTPMTAATPHDRATDVDWTS